MPIGRRPGGGTSNTQAITTTDEEGIPVPLIDQAELDPQVLIDLGIVEGDDYPQGIAVSASQSGESLAFEPCSAVTATGKGENFYGFLKVATAAGEPTRVITARGATLTPLLEVGTTPVAGEDAFLSTVSGRVTNVAPNESGNTVLRVGYYISATAIVFTTDMRTKIS
jgi:hypothetical protein